MFLCSSPSPLYLAPCQTSNSIYSSPSKPYPSSKSSNSSDISELCKELITNFENRPNYPDVSSEAVQRILKCVAKSGLIDPNYQYKPLSEEKRTDLNINKELKNWEKRINGDFEKNN